MNPYVGSTWIQAACVDILCRRSCRLCILYLQDCAHLWSYAGRKVPKHQKLFNVFRKCIISIVGADDCQHWYMLVELSERSQGTFITWPEYSHTCSSCRWQNAFLGLNDRSLSKTLINCASSNLQHYHSSFIIALSPQPYISYTYTLFTCINPSQSCIISIMHFAWLFIYKHKKEQQRL